MPNIFDKRVVAVSLSEIIDAVAVYRRRKIAEIEQDLAYELRGTKLASRTLKSWKNEKSIPETLDDGVFFGLIYEGLLTERFNLDWLVTILKGTSVPLYTPLSQALVQAYLGQARFQGIPLTKEKIKDVVSIFFEPTSSGSKAKGLGYLRRVGAVNLEPFQPLIPLEPVTREFIRESTEICVEGLSLYRFIEAFFHDFVYAVKNGATIRVVLVDPDSPAVNMITFRSTSSASSEVQRQRIGTTIETLKRINQVSGTTAVSIRNLDHMPPYGITAYRRVDKPLESVCQVRLYTFRTPTSEAPSIVATPVTNPLWFHFFNRQFDLIWDASKE